VVEGQAVEPIDEVAAMEVDGDGELGGSVGARKEVARARAARGRADDETAAMEVDGDGELGGGVGAQREVDAGSGGTSVDVPGDDAGEGVGAGRDDGVDAGANDAAALALAAAGREVQSLSRDPWRQRLVVLAGSHAAAVGELVNAPRISDG
jgi:hypothetical protein